MRTVLVAVLSAFYSCPAVLGLAQGQTPTSDSRTLQSILEEVSKLRQDLQTTSATVQRMQILLYRVRTELAHRVKQQEEFLERTQDPASRKEIEDELARLKDWMEKTAGSEPEAQAKEAECTNELRLEQAKLNELQDQLDRLDKKLENAFPRQ
jgi:chromosome segregation ATPase